MIINCTFTNDLATCKRAWQAHEAPTYPHEFDNAISLRETDGSDGTYWLLVRWNVLRDYYEAEPVEKGPSNTFQIISMPLQRQAYDILLAELESIGITHHFRIELEGADTKSVPTTLLDYLFPIPVRNLTKPR